LRRVAQGRDRLHGRALVFEHHLLLVDAQDVVLHLLQLDFVHLFLFEGHEGGWMVVGEWVEVWAAVCE
jgi:hypothetical protein